MDLPSLSRAGDISKVCRIHEIELNKASRLRKRPGQILHRIIINNGHEVKISKLIPSSETETRYSWVRDIRVKGPVGVEKSFWNKLIGG